MSHVFFNCVFLLFLLAILSDPLSMYAASPPNPDFCSCGWLQTHLSPPSFISHLSFMIPSIIETGRPAPSSFLMLPEPQTPSRVQALGLLPPPQDLNYAWCVSVRRRILRDLHNPCSLEHHVRPLCMGRCTCAHNEFKNKKKKKKRNGTARQKIHEDVTNMNVAATAQATLQLA